MANADSLKTEETKETSDNGTETKMKVSSDKDTDTKVAADNGTLTKVTSDNGTVTETKVTEEKTDEVKPESQPLTKELESKIIRQMEYYFGDINLPRDKFLLEQIQLDDGWVPLTVMLTFKRLSALSTDAELIAQVLFNHEGNLIEISEDRKKIRRNPERPVPEYNDERRKELMMRTAYVKGFPAEEELEPIIKFFETFGTYEAVSMRNYLDKATKKTVFKGSVFIIFKDVETCKKFIELEEVKFGDIVLIRKWQADYIEGKKLEREERNSKRGKGKKEKEGDVTKKTHNFPKGAMLHVEGITKDQTPRESIRSKISEINGSDPAFVTYNKGDKECYIRFGETDGAIEFMKKLTDNKLEIDGNETTVRVLEGEEEDNYLILAADKMDKFRSYNKQFGRGRGRKRRAFGDSGPRAKHERK